MAFVETALAVTRQDFQSPIEGYLVGALGEYCKAEVAEVNGYRDYVQHWRNEVERILFTELSFFVQRVQTKTPFDKRGAIEEIIAEYDSVEDFQKDLLVAKKAIATRYLKQPGAEAAWCRP